MLEITADQFDTEVLKSGKVAVDFYSTECPPCEALAPKFQNLSMLYGEDVKFVKIFRQGNRELAEELGIKGSPTVIFYDNGELVGDTLTGGIKRSELMANLDTMLEPARVSEIKKKIIKKETETTALILGGGPAGLTAATYLGQAKIKTMIVDLALPGGQVSTSHSISNYPGFIEPQPGFMLAHFMAEQAKLNGVKERYAVEVTDVDLENKTIVVDGYETIKAKYLIISTGASPRYLGVPGEKEYKGKGISYCATCDAKYYEGKEVVVVGGGNSAVEEAEFISKFASKITVIQNLEKLTANQTAVDKLLSNPKVNVHYNSVATAFVKDGDKMRVDLKNIVEDNESSVVTDGIFIFVGMKPNTELFGKSLAVNDWGYVKTDEDKLTNIHNVYAVGDIIDKKYRQITTAAADGTIAAMHISKMEG